MIIDSHCHIYPDKIALKASLATGRFYSIEMRYDGRISTMLEAGKEAGIDKFIAESVATTPAQVNSINNFIASAVADYPDKIIGLGALHPDSEDREGDIRSIVSLGLKGVKLHPDIQNFRLDDEKCLWMYEMCEKYKLPLLIHAGDNRYDNSNPNRILPILKQFKNLTVIAAHFGGYSVWEEAAEQLHGAENLYVDCSSSFHRLSDDTVKKLINKYGSSRVMFGTDFPMWDMKQTLDRFLSLNLDDETNEKILYKNAVGLYGISFE